MNNLELTIEALKQCVPPEAFAAAMAKVEVEGLRDVPGTSDIERMAQDTLTMLGVPSNLLGYRFLTIGLTMLVFNPGLAHNITKGLYPEIAERYGSTTKSRVERGIRHAIEVAWNNADTDDLNEYFGRSVSYYKGKPTNSAFMTRAADLLRRKLDQDGGQYNA